MLLAGCALAPVLPPPQLSEPIRTTESPAYGLKLPTRPDDTDQLAVVMPQLARQVTTSYVENDRRRYLDNLLRLQLVSADPATALATLAELHETPSEGSSSTEPVLVALEIYATARTVMLPDEGDFKNIYGAAFRAAFAGLSDLEASDVTYWLETPGFVHERNLADALSGAAEDDLSEADAIKLVRAYLAQQMNVETQAMLPGLIAAEKERRYEVADDVLIHTPDGGTLSALVVRPRSAQGPLPTALLFTIYTDETGNRQAAETAAAHGYVGVVADTRGKRLSPDPVEPYEHEVDDTYAVIDWTSRQPWSNGDVGMYGGSYSGYTAWAATKRLHPALKTIVAYVAAMPGLGLPMWNNVFLNANYGWGFYVSNNKSLDNDVYRDPDRWDALNNKWYASGRPYREIDKVDGTPNPLLQRWLDHPAYDSYWQAKAPYRQDYARIDIPVLSITGYYDDGQISALHYLTEHLKYNKNGEHYLIVGPYDHFSAQSRRKPRELRGYTLDPVAQFDTQELTFQWLDHVLRDGARPALLKDRVNYQVMGANVWRHARSLDAMSTEILKLYLTNEPAGEKRFRLTGRLPAKSASLEQVVDLADRGASHNDYYPAPIKGKEASSTGLAFVSEPLDEPISVNGMFSGALNVTINKRDVDLGAVLYEVQPDGTLLQLSYYLGRASFADNMSHRSLLKPGEKTSIEIKRSLLVSRQLQAGSRLMVVVDVNLNPYHQINYGTGRDVSDESIADADEPLEIAWHSDSYLEIPISR